MWWSQVQVLPKACTLVALLCYVRSCVYPSLWKQDFIQQKKYPNWTHVTTVREGSETPLFKQNFTNWVSKSEVTKLPTGRTSTATKGIYVYVVSRI